MLLLSRIFGRVWWFVWRCVGRRFFETILRWGLSWRCSGRFFFWIVFSEGSCQGYSESNTAVRNCPSLSTLESALVVLEARMEIPLSIASYPSLPTPHFRSLSSLFLLCPSVSCFLGRLWLSSPSCPSLSFRIAIPVRVSCFLLFAWPSRLYRSTTVIEPIANTSARGLSPRASSSPSPASSSEYTHDASIAKPTLRQATSAPCSRSWPLSPGQRAACASAAHSSCRRSRSTRTASERRRRKNGSGGLTFSR